VASGISALSGDVTEAILIGMIFFEPLSISNLFLAVALGGISVVWFEAMKLSQKFSSKL
jgi:hypothetical protein